MQLTSLLAFSVAALAVHACPGEDHAHGHVHKPRAYPQVPLALPTRPLEWGDVNIIHTTDSHGWLLGHQKTSFPEPNYRWVATILFRDPLELLILCSGDLGDFASFVAHMKQIALVSARSTSEPLRYTQLVPRKRMLICSWLTPGTCMMVRGT